MLSSPILSTFTSPSTGQLNLQRLQRVLFCVLTRCQCFYNITLFGVIFVWKSEKLKLDKKSKGKLEKVPKSLGNIGNEKCWL